MSEQDERSAPLGQRSIHVEGDTVVSTVRGTLTGEEMQQLLDNFVRIKREYGVLFVLYDGRHCTGVDAAARKLAASKPTANRDADLQVVFGISFAIRVILNMLIRAQKVLLNRDIAVHVFEKELDARAFFDTGRERIRREKNIKKSL
jgi:hypothetical protein